MTPVHVRSRIFGANLREPDPAALLEFLARGGVSVEGQFHGDEEGWFRLGLTYNGQSMRAERFLVSEAGIRDELNTWAAWVEASQEDEEHNALMERLISTQQLFVLYDFPAELAERLCQYLSAQCDGIYQADARGFFTASGQLLLRET